jgi:hypothetical protein
MASFIREIKQDVSKVKAQVLGSSTYGPVATFFTIFQGRATTFAILFALEGIALLVATGVLIGVGIHAFLHGKDVSGIVSLLTALASVIMSSAAFNGLIQTTMVAHSTKEDWMAIKQQQVQNQQDALTMTQNPPPTPPTGSAS